MPRIQFTTGRLLIAVTLAAGYFGMRHWLVRSEAFAFWSYWSVAWLAAFLASAMLVTTAFSVLLIGAGVIVWRRRRAAWLAWKQVAVKVGEAAVFSLVAAALLTHVQLVLWHARSDEWARPVMVAMGAVGAVWGAWLCVGPVRSLLRPVEEGS